MDRARIKLAAYWDGLPRWFRTAFTILAILYFAAWAYSAFLATFNASNVSIPVLAKDATEYATLSDSILTSHTFTLDGVIPETFRSPGYPAFIAAIRSVCGGSFLAVTLIQMLLMLANALLIQRLGRRFFSNRIGTIAATIFLLNPVTLIIPLVIHTETLFVFLFLSLFLVLSGISKEKLWYGAISGGMLAAAAIYVRPMGFWAIPMFLAPILLANISWKKRFVVAIAVIAVLGLLIVPWMERNRRETGVFGFSSLSTEAILSASIPMFKAHQNGTSIGTEMDKEIKDVGSTQVQWRQLSYEPSLTPYIAGFVRANFLPYAEYHLVTSLPFFFASDVEWSAYTYTLMTHQPFHYGEAAIFDLANGDFGSFFSKIIHPWWKFSERMLYCLMAASALYAMWKLRRRMIVWICAGIIIYLALVNAEVATARHRFPADPFIYLLVSAGAVTLVESRTKKTAAEN